MNYTACIHLSVGESIRYLPPLRWIIVNSINNNNNNNNDYNDNDNANDNDNNNDNDSNNNKNNNLIIVSKKCS